MDTIAPRLSRTLLILAGCLAATLAEAALDQWSTGGPAGVGPINAVAVDPVNPLVVYAASGAGGAVSKSVDGGLAWQPVTANLPGGAKAALAIDAVNPKIVYVGINVGGVFKSTNGGGQWSQRSNGLPVNVGIVGTLAIDPTNTATIYAGTQSGLYKSIDSGANWVAMNTGFTPDPTPSIDAVAIDPKNPSTVYVGTGGFDVWKSIDGGASWLATSTGITSSLINDLAIDPRRPGVLYAATSSSGVFRTTDGAQTWIALNTGLTVNTIQALAVTRSGTCVHAGGNVNGASGPVFDLAWVAGCGDLPSFHGLWCNSPPYSESGWGINFAHQNDTIFATWFTYDLAGKPSWLGIVANKTSPNVYAGDLFTTAGPAFNAQPFDPATVVESPVGTGTFTVVDGNNVQFDYTVNGVTQSKALTRQVFAAPGTVCE